MYSAGEDLESALQRWKLQRQHFRTLSRFRDLEYSVRRWYPHSSSVGHLASQDAHVEKSWRISLVCDWDLVSISITPF